MNDGEEGLPDSGPRNYIQMGDNISHQTQTFNQYNPSQHSQMNVHGNSLQGSTRNHHDNLPYPPPMFAHHVQNTMGHPGHNYPDDPSNQDNAHPSHWHNNPTILNAQNVQSQNHYLAALAPGLSRAPNTDQAVYRESYQTVINGTFTHYPPNFVSGNNGQHLPAQSPLPLDHYSNYLTNTTMEASVGHPHMENANPYHGSGGVTPGTYTCISEDGREVAASAVNTMKKRTSKKSASQESTNKENASKNSVSKSRKRKTDTSPAPAKCRKTDVTSAPPKRRKTGSGKTVADFINVSLSATPMVGMDADVARAKAKVFEPLDVEEDDIDEVKENRGEWIATLIQAFDSPWAATIPGPDRFHQDLQPQWTEWQESGYVNTMDVLTDPSRPNVTEAVATVYFEIVLECHAPNSGPRKTTVSTTTNPFLKASERLELSVAGIQDVTLVRHDIAIGQRLHEFAADPEDFCRGKEQNWFGNLCKEPEFARYQKKKAGVNVKTETDGVDLEFGMFDTEFQGLQKAQTEDGGYGAGFDFGTNEAYAGGEGEVEAGGAYARGFDQQMQRSGMPEGEEQMAGTFTPMKEEIFGDADRVNEDGALGGLDDGGFEDFGQDDSAGGFAQDGEADQ